MGVRRGRCFLLVLVVYLLSSHQTMGAGMSKKVQERVQTCKKGGGTELSLDECEIFDKMPEKITSLSSLTHLDVSRNHLTSLSSNLGRLTKLTYLDFSYNEIDAFPKSFSRLKKLEKLDCSANYLTALPDDMQEFQSLTQLNIAGNSIKTLPASLSSCSRLQILDWNGSRLESFDGNIFRISSLKELHLYQNMLTSIPEQITQLSYLEVLDISQNQIKEVPAFLQRLGSLRVLNLSNNQIAALPKEISGLIHLQVLNMGHNLITDVSEIDMSQMHEMQELDFHHNQLKEFNEGIGQMQQLRDLNLEDNMLKALPREVGWLGKTLRSLLVARNKLVRLPGEIAFLNPTVKLTLDGNPLVDPFNMLMNNMKTLTHIKPYCVTYLKAYPANSMARGDAVMESHAGEGTRFFIEARDYEGNLRVNGKDKFTVAFVPEHSSDASTTNYAIVKDLEDGTYQVAFNNRVAGTYRLHITNESVHIRNSPFTHQVLPGPTNPAHCTVVGSGFAPNTPPPQSGTINTFAIRTGDQFGNMALRGGEEFSVTIEGGNNPVPLLEDLDDGTYRVQWTPAWPDMYQISIGFNGYHIAGSPFQVSVPQ